LADLSEGRDKLVAGVISSMRTQMTQRGKMLIAMLDDGSGQCEITIFNEQFEANKQLFKEDELLVVQGQTRYDSFSGGLRFTAETVMDLERARSRYADSLRLSVNGNADSHRLREVLYPHRFVPPAAPSAGAGAIGTNGANGVNGAGQSTGRNAGPGRGAGNNAGGAGKAGNGYGGRGGRNGGERASAYEPSGLRVRIHYTGQGVECDSTLGDAWRVRPTDELLATLQAEFTDQAVEIQYPLR
jgi:DNA polymerase-3 subunit alpha